MVGTLEKLDHGAGAQIRAADADDHQRLGVAADLLRGGLNAGKLLLVIVHGEVDPAEKIVSGAGALHQRFDGGLAGGLVGRGSKAGGAGTVKMKHKY